MPKSPWKHRSNPMTTSDQAMPTGRDGISADPSFEASGTELAAALALLVSPPKPGRPNDLSASLPETGLGDAEALAVLAPLVLGGAQRLGSSTAFAHMDPPTPWVTWVMALWNASVNQNLLHPDVAPVVRDLECRVVDWLTPAFCMNGGHMTPGSTVSNLTALWAARELRKVTRVAASSTAHLSVAKSAHLLGLDYLPLPTDAEGRIDPEKLPDDLGKTALVLTAGVTSTGAIDPLKVAGRAAWTHVDAAWAGPLRLSERHAAKLEGIKTADSVAVSAHKWLFQPKESGLLMFQDTEAAHRAVSFGGAYLQVPNVGLLGSHGAVAVPLLATLIAWGRSGVAARIEHCMRLADDLHANLSADPRVAVFGPQASGVVLWRPKVGDARTLLQTLPEGSASLTTVDGEVWLRHVAANPMADIEHLWMAIERALT